jgi:hypothetical protein
VHGHDPACRFRQDEAVIRRRAKSRAGITAAQKIELDSLAGYFVMLRAGAFLFTDEGRRQWRGGCQRCGKIEWLSWCHVFTRSIYSVRWDPDNSFAWCRGCHRWMDQHWESKRDWVIERIGQKAFARLKMRAQACTKPDYNLVKLSLR